MRNFEKSIYPSQFRFPEVPWTRSKIFTQPRLKSTHSDLIFKNIYFGPGGKKSLAISCKYRSLGKMENFDQFLFY